MPDITLKATHGAFPKANRTRTAGAPIVSGNYSSAHRYDYRYTPPRTFDAAGNVTGSLMVNPLTGRTSNFVFDASPPSSYAVVENLTNQGSRAANKALLQSRIDAHLNSTVHVQLNLAGGVDWGTDIFLRARARTNRGTICIRSANTPGSYGSTLRKTQLGNLAKFLLVHNGAAGNVALPAFAIQKGASHYRLEGLDITYADSFQPGRFDGGHPGTLGMIFSSASSNTEDIRAMSGFNTTQAEYPYRIVIDRCAVHGRGLDACQVAMKPFGLFIAVVGCLSYDVGSINSDSQNVSIQAGAGPYLIWRNDFECALGENILIGAGEAGDVASIPCDGQIMDNRLVYPASWRDAPGQRGHKNLMEWKLGKRWLFEGNHCSGFRGTNYKGQLYSLVIKCTADDGGTGADVIHVCHDITIRLNRFDDSWAWLGLIGADVYYSWVQDSVNRIDISHNLVSPFGDGSLSLPLTPQDQIMLNVGRTPNRTLSEAELLRDVSLHHNTVFGPYSSHGYSRVVGWAGWSGDDNQIQQRPMVRMKVEGNVFAMPDAMERRGEYLSGSGRSGYSSASSYAAFTTKAGASGNVWRNNAVPGAGSQKIADDLAYANMAALQLDASFAPMSGSPLRTADVDGGLVGADVPLVQSATAYARGLT
jgi:hypothetical protein